MFAPSTPALSSVASGICVTPSCFLRSALPRGIHARDGTTSGRQVCRSTQLSRPWAAAGAELHRATYRAKACIARSHEQDASMQAGASATYEFKVPCRTSFGQVLAVVGGRPELGSWDAEKAVRLCWSEGHVWAGSVAVASHAASKHVEFKVVLLSEGGVLWESGPNRVLPARDAAEENRVDVMCEAPVWSVDSAQNQHDAQADTAHGSTASTSALAADTVRCEFVVPGWEAGSEAQVLALVGSCPELGSWDPARALLLTQQLDGSWTACADLPVAALTGGSTEFKLLVLEHGKQPEWEKRHNRKLQVGTTAAAACSGLHVSMQWAQAKSTKVKLHTAAAAPTVAAAAASPAAEALSAGQQDPEAEAGEAAACSAAPVAGSTADTASSPSGSEASQHGSPLATAAEAETPATALPAESAAAPAAAVAADAGSRAAAVCSWAVLARSLPLLMSAAAATATSAPATTDASAGSAAAGSVAAGFTAAACAGGDASYMVRYTDLDPTISPYPQTSPAAEA